MSKDQKKTIELPVETVDNLRQTFAWISSSISFWHLENTYPTNLINKVCEDMFQELIECNLERDQNISKSRNKPRSTFII